MKTNTARLLPILLTAAITPFIIYGKAVPIGDTLFQYWSNERVHIDMFSYWKSVFILVISGIALMIMLYDRFVHKKTFVKGFFYIPVVAYAVFVVGSGLLSEHKNTAVWGIADRHEGMLVQLAYLVIFIYAVNYIRELKHVRSTLHFLVAAAVVMAVLGLFQFVGYDFLKSETVQKLLIPDKYSMYISDIIFKAGDSFHYQNSIYSTLYNANTFGLYMSLVIPVAAGMLLTAKSKTGRVLYGSALLILSAALIGSNSRGSYVAVMISMTMLLVVIRIKKIPLNYIKIAALAIVVLIAFIGMDNISGGNIAKRLATSTPGGTQISSENSKINHFSIDADTLHITNGIFNLDIKIENQQLLFIENGEILDISHKADGIYNIAGEKYTGMDIKIENNLVSIIKNKSLLRFAVKDDTFYYVNAKGKVIQPIADEVLKTGFKGFESLGSGRGYIWSRSLPLLRDTLFLGKGSDNFIYYFPQHDDLGKLQFMKDANIVIDKPHNFYLQMAINSGMLSLTAFLTLVVYWGIRRIKMVKTGKPEDENIIVSIALLGSIMAFLLNGLFTDSHIGVMPVFWILLGIGFSQYYQMQK